MTGVAVPDREEDFDDLALLTEEERAAAADPDDVTAGATGAPAAADPDAEDGADAGEGAESAAADAAAGTAAEEAAKAQAQADADADAAAAAAATPPPADAEPAADVPPLAELGPPPEWSQAQEDRLKAIDGEKDTLLDSFDSGEMTRAEYKAKLEAIDGEKAALLKAEAANDLYWQQDKAIWQRDLKSYQTANPILWKGFDQAATPEDQLRTSIFEENVNKILEKDAAGRMTNRQVLELAHRNVQAAFPALFQAPAAAPAPKADPEAAPQPGTKLTPRTDKRPLPPTVGKMPASHNAAPDDSRAATLENLMDADPAAYEAMVLRMSDAELAELDRRMS